MKNIVKLSLIFLLIVSSFLFIARFSYAAKAKNIDYMPRDQELVTTQKPDSASTGYPYNLNESNRDDCLRDLNTRISRCNHCLDLQTQCSNCCITMIPATARKTQCQDLADAANKRPVVFEPINSTDPRKACDIVAGCDLPAEADPANSYSNFKTYCSSTSIPGCQALGCPDSNGEPKNHGADKCEKEEDGTGAFTGAFICNTNTIDKLENPGCSPSAGNEESTIYAADCDNLSSPKYTITAIPDPGDCPTGYPQCWKYELTNELKTCISNCKDVADHQEKSAKDLNCCNKDSSICCKDVSCMYGERDVGADPRIRPGYQNNCTNDNACFERINWPECLVDPNDPFCCDKLTPANCIALTQERDGLIEGMVAGTSFGCFGDISNSGDELAYEFVAKSNEKLMVIWQIQTQPEYYYCGTSACSSVQKDDASAMLVLPSPAANPPDTYFYTIVKIFDETVGNTEVYPHPYADTIMNQRSFTASFSVFAAIATGKKPDGKSIFDQGHKYKVKLYYLIAPLSNYVLRSKVSQSQLLVLRIRE